VAVGCRAPGGPLGRGRPRHRPDAGANTRRTPGGDRGGHPGVPPEPSGADHRVDPAGPAARARGRAGPRPGRHPRPSPGAVARSGLPGGRQPGGRRDRRGVLRLPLPPLSPHGARDQDAPDRGPPRPPGLQGAAHPRGGVGPRRTSGPSRPRARQVRGSPRPPHGRDRAPHEGVGRPDARGDRPRSGASSGASWPSPRRSASMAPRRSSSAGSSSWARWTSAPSGT
jgi:hypothetical protein